MADILTRREARQQAKQNRGYNRGQFQLAMANAKNALRDNSDLRGRELRQTARRMVAGTGEYAQSNLPSTFEEWINSPVLAGRPSSGGAEAARAAVQRGISKANRIGVVTPIVNPDTNFSGLVGGLQQETPTADLTGAGSFDNAFALARKNGMKVFTWNGKKYGTKMDPNWRERWERVKPKSSDGSSLQEGIDEELAAQENAAIQDRIESFKSDLGPTMNAPVYMGYITHPYSNAFKPGWYALEDTSPSQYNWYRGWFNNKYGDHFVSKDGSDRFFNPFPDDLQKKYKRNNPKFFTEPATNNIINTNPRKNIDLYRKQLMDKWSYILANQSEYSPREIQYAKENLPLYQKRFGNTYE